jgi:hypothetical protein
MEAMQTTHRVEAAELVKIVPAQRQARFYRLDIWPAHRNSCSAPNRLDTRCQPRSALAVSIDRFRIGRHLIVG